ncbi:ral guanine nucleotide dissociation stimulator-like [Odocoileus virginianus]|uniref:Ral guanine nucleotide dissociation stimulator-like n=1 Tax=Odocoileus virginianus TaxID=9874 RepID=A0ABM4HC95_ODOVR
MEGSAQGGVKSKRGRPPQKPPRTHPGAQSRAATGLSTPGSDPEPRGPNPLRQHEDLEPSAAERREVVAPRAGPRDPLRGHRDLIHPVSKTLGQLVTGHHSGQIGPLCLHDPQPQAPMSQPLSPQPERPPAPAPARALAGEPESGHELPPLQGEPALAPAQDPDAHDD